ncbi:hypothetical protein K6U52_05645 [Vibrio vulnificus]|uniref:hypothetical protein n=1 Tax=Vibrio vulnificus TaxID=672 RepID=UPI001DB0616A|nr:hypothetical protein [Vibrio vulnificus]EGR7978170.1 hypothetical protein [Vibrio vulnificus]EJN6829919.1 hypothetical protein [Vibrio cidicii]MCG6312779.1 hypothetical protein [Vibrio vulnificus]MCU8111857.1 hypothetical protein [Vibrio vulnificus]
MIEIINEPIKIESIINALATLMTAVIAFAIMGVNNYFSHKRLKMELAQQAKEADKERLARRKQENIKAQLSSLESVFSSIHKIRAYSYRCRSLVAIAMITKTNIKDNLDKTHETLTEIQFLDESMQVVVNVYLGDLPDLKTEIIENVASLVDLNFRAGLHADAGEDKELDSLLKDELMPQIKQFIDYLTDLEIDLCEYIESIQEQA